MKGTKRNAPEPTASIDKLTLTANLRTEEFAAWERTHAHDFVPAKVAKTRWGFDLYEKGYRLPDGTHVSRDKTMGDFHEIRVQFNPNREPMEPDTAAPLVLPSGETIGSERDRQYDRDAKDATIPLLACLRDVRITQIDVALDYLGVRIHEYEVLYPRAKRTTTSTGYGYMESMAFGSNRSDLQVLFYGKERQKKKLNERILTIGGEMITPKPNEPWLRIEASMKGTSVLRSDAFKGLKMFRRGSFKPPKGMSTDMVERLGWISQYPPALDYPTVHQNTRDDWRKKLLAGVEMLEPHPQKVYEEHLEVIKEYLSEFYLSPVGMDGLSQQTKRVLGVED